MEKLIARLAKIETIIHACQIVICKTSPTDKVAWKFACDANDAQVEKAERIRRVLNMRYGMDV